jgi:hypothetical protein
MSIETNVKEIFENFEKTSSEQIIHVLKDIQPNFKSQITKDYLSGKLESVNNASDEDEKKKLCNNLKPYLDWYLQGL